MSSLYDGYSVHLTSLGAIPFDEIPTIGNVFTNPIPAANVVSGELVGNTTVNAGYLQSNNYVANTTGWQLTPTSGDLNFAISVDSLDIPDTTTANSFHVDTDGNSWWGTNVATGYATATAKVLATGAATFKSATIGNWSVNTTSIYTGTEDHSGYTANAGDITIYSDGSDSSIHAKNWYIDTTGVLTCTGATVAASTISTPTITGIQTGSEIAIQGWQSTLVFSATDADTVAWAGGDLTLLDGTVYSISGGNTGNMSALTYVYLDIATSVTVLQTTTTAATAVGTGKILIAVAQNNASSDATFQVFGGTGGILLKAANIAADTITANEIAANTITGTQITTMDLTAKTLTADTGTIAAFTLAASTLSATNLTLTSGAANTANIAVGTGSNLAGMNSGNAGADIAFWAGDTFANRAIAPFRVNLQGDVTMTSATISGILVEYVLGESFVEGNTGYHSRITKFDYSPDFTVAAGSSLSVGVNSAFTKIAQPILTTGALSGISVIKIRLSKTGTPTDNLIIRVETDNAGDPSGSLVDANATLTLDSSTLTTSAVNYFLEFDGSFSLGATTDYHIVFSRSTGIDGSNYANVAVDGADPYPAHDVLKFDGASTWSVGAVNNQVVMLLTTRDRMWLTDANGSGLQLLPIGYAGAAGSAGDTVVFNLSGVSNVAITGTAAIGETMYLSNTSGEVQNSAGASSVKVGRMATTTQMLIIPPPL